MIIHPGGGGQYGWLELPENLKKEETRNGQLSLADLEKLNPENESKTAKKKGKKPRKETAETGKEPEDASQSSLFDF